MNFHTTPSYWFPRQTTVPSAGIELKVSVFVRWAFYAFMFSLPYEVVVPSWFPFWLQENLSIPRITGVILTLAFLLRTKPQSWVLPPAFAAFATFFLFFAASMLRLGFDHTVVVLQQLQMVALFVIAYNLFIRRRVVFGALLSFSISCALSSVLILTGITVDIYQVTKLGGRITGFGANPNEYSGILVVGALVGIGIGYYRKDKFNLQYLPIIWAIALVTISAVALSGSRGSTAALVFGLSMFLLSKGSFWFQVRNLFLFAIVSCFVFLALSNAPILKDRWKETILMGSISGHDVIALEAMQMVLEKPLIGWGPAAKTVLAIRVNSYGLVRSAHNMILAMLTFNGILGALPYFYGYLLVFWAARRARSGTEGILPLAIFACVFVTDMASGELPKKLHWVFFAYQLAAGQICEDNIKQSLGHGK